MNEEETAQEKYIKVTNVIILFPVLHEHMLLRSAPRLREQLSRPLMELHLEDGHVLRLMGIPMEVAVQIWSVVNRRELKPAEDFRLSVVDLVCELTKIRRVIISDLIPELGVYVADLEVESISENSKIRKVFKMVPSHAVLLALKCKVDIFVSEKLLRLHIEEEESQSTTEKSPEEDIAYW